MPNRDLDDDVVDPLADEEDDDALGSADDDEDEAFDEDEDEDDEEFDEDEDENETEPTGEVGSEGGSPGERVERIRSRGGVGGSEAAGLAREEDEDIGR